MTNIGHRAVHVLADAAEVGIAAARSFAELAKERVSRAGRFNVALSGGSAPRAMYANLAGPLRDQVPWESVHFYWGDERCVSPRHADSNYGMARRLLLDHVGARPEQVHAMDGMALPRIAAASYRQSLEELPISPRGVPEFDLVLLGLGADGHTASLFPQFREVLLNARGEWVVSVPRSEAHPWERITLTLDVINEARRVAFLVLGAKKAMALKQAIEQETLDVPASLVRPRAGSLDWYVDAPASIALTPETRTVEEEA